MGISPGAAKLIAATLRGRPAGGRALTFGVQAVELSADALAAMRAGAAPGQSLPAHAAPENGKQSSRIHQDDLFGLFGFDAIESLDYYDAEKPTHVADLNQPLPDALSGQFELVYDGGTLEHCFNTTQVMGNVVRLLKPGGRIIHHVPMNNWVDHGFYQFSPTFFFDFYHANGFVDPSMKLHFMSRRAESFIAYDPVADPALPSAFGSGTKCLCFFTAMKGPEPDTTAREIILPIQRRYRTAFGGEAGARIRLKGPRRWKASILKRTYVWRAKRL